MQVNVILVNHTQRSFHLSRLGDNSVTRTLEMPYARVPSPGTPGEGRVRVFREDEKDPHPNPFPEYREREKCAAVFLPQH